MLLYGCSLTRNVLISAAMQDVTIHAEIRWEGRDDGRGRLLPGAHQPWACRYQRHWGMDGAVTRVAASFFCRRLGPLSDTGWGTQKSVRVE